MEAGNKNEREEDTQSKERERGTGNMRYQRKGQSEGRTGPDVAQQLFPRPHAGSTQRPSLEVFKVWRGTTENPSTPSLLHRSPSTSAPQSSGTPSTHASLLPHLSILLPSCLSPLLPRPPVCPPTFLSFLSRHLAIPWHCHSPTQQFLLITQTPRSPPWAYFWLPLALTLLEACGHLMFLPRQCDCKSVRMCDHTEVNVRATKQENERESENRSIGRRQRCSRVPSVKLWSVGRGESSSWLRRGEVVGVGGVGESFSWPLSPLWTLFSSCDWFPPRHCHRDQTLRRDRENEGLRRKKRKLLGQTGRHNTDTLSFSHRKSLPSADCIALTTVKLLLSTRARSQEGGSGKQKLQTQEGLGISDIKLSPKTTRCTTQQAQKNTPSADERR
ncbi:hypothetical protein Q8A73_006451 [Channa argus]|nr:hypothetical protein Q8A73_006451 [Channa argus]